ncbi:MAG TPA: DUF3710 domain-containing protein [Nocardioides sp.]|jgi:hypothetical protein|uniref:DUF3710 domain-containing protein n=1 Tax=Nocardioides sp. TaxID=35761 RepID=UPI002E2FB2E3|nr:DUF3710 domain-containing protein [Nocardioides sp.]HEX3930540.1 DUF3710 domain-containing protein [Nocardioides sp.]
MFRRKARSEPDKASADEATNDDLEHTSARAGTGPWDSGETPDDGLDRVDLGSLRVPGREGAELRLQVDETTGEVQSVMLAAEEGALELRAFAAPRGGDLWSEIRPQIAADVARHGGTATEREGRFGPELVCQMQVVMPDGTQALQPSLIVGVNGARWLLRATFLGQPAVEPELSPEWEEALASVVVHRGTHAMPSGDALPLSLPDDAQRLA